MKSKKLTWPSPTHEAADRLLAEIGFAQGNLKRLEAEALAQVEDLRREWAERLKSNRDHLEILGQKLVALEKSNRQEVFGPGDSVRVDLPHGALLYEKGSYVVKPRKVNVLANLKAHDLADGIRVVESVDWDVLNTWPEDKLALAGTRREVRETFGYETREQRPGRAGG